MLPKKIPAPLLVIKGLTEPQERADFLEFVKELKAKRSFPYRVCLSVAITSSKLPAKQFPLFDRQTRALYMVQYKNHVDQETILSDISKIVKTNPLVQIIEIDVPHIDDAIFKTLHKSYKHKIRFALKVEVTESSSCNDTIGEIEDHKNVISYISIHPNRDIEKAAFERKILTLTSELKETFKKIPTIVNGTAYHSTTFVSKILSKKIGLEIDLKREQSDAAPLVVVAKILVGSFFEKNS